MGLLTGLCALPAELYPRTKKESIRFCLYSAMRWIPDYAMSQNREIIWIIKPTYKLVLLCLISHIQRTGCIITDSSPFVNTKFEIFQKICETVIQLWSQRGAWVDYMGNSSIFVERIMRFFRGKSQFSTCVFCLFMVICKQGATKLRFFV